MRKKEVSQTTFGDFKIGANSVEISDIKVNMTSFDTKTGIAGFRDWRAWLATLPWRYKWFIVLILSRPIIDLTYDVNIILSFSLLEIVGLLTPLIIFFLILTKQLPLVIKTRSSVSKYFYTWCFFLFLNSFLILVSEPTIPRLDIVLRITFPFYLFLFLRHFIQSKKQLEGILLTVLYSAIFPALLLLYEVFVGPFKIQRSRGIERYMAGYADAGNLALLILFSLLIVGYFWMKQNSDASERWIKNRHLILIITLCIFGLVHINHATTYITFFAIFSLFIFYNLRTKKQIFTIILLLVIPGTVFIQSEGQNKIATLINTDLNVLKGEQRIEAAFHGRMSRWEIHLERFYEWISLPERMIGTIGVIRPSMLGAGAHNDYLRILFSTGYIGLVIYMFFIFSFFIASRNMPISQQFLTRGMILIILLLSFSTTPTVYMLVIYVFCSIAAFVVLPASLRN